MRIEEVQFGSEHDSYVIRQVVEASFEDWINFIFGRERKDGHWAFDESELNWKLPDEVTADYLAQTYENPKFWRDRFTLQQIADGLSYTWSSSLGNICFLFADKGIPWPLRQRLIQSLVPLYQECFGCLCQSGLSHLNECAENPLNGVCYMFWDVCPLYGKPNEPSARDCDIECLRVMDQTLTIDHDACRESALHGLGHWAVAYPSRVALIVTQGLKTVRKRLRVELLNYAESAQSGSVL
jgi:hypothetical protein